MKFKLKRKLEEGMLEVNYIIDENGNLDYDDVLLDGNWIDIDEVKLLTDLDTFEERLYNKMQNSPYGFEDDYFIEQDQLEDKLW